MNSIQPELITVPLTKEAHRCAEKFAQEQATPQKRKGVYFNTLAVYAVHTYLKWLHCDTILDDSESWHPGIIPSLHQRKYSSNFHAEN